MIKKKENHIVLEFGNGDIGVTEGYLMDDPKKIAIGFIDQPAREIGSETELENDKAYPMDIFPVVMTFTKRESIEALNCYVPEITGTNSRRNRQ